MQIPASNLLADRFPRFVGNGRAEVDEVLAEPILRSPRLKTIAQKIELLVRVSPPPVVILAIDDLRLHRMKLQPAFLPARGSPLPPPPRFPPLSANARPQPPHPARRERAKFCPPPTRRRHNAETDL